MIRLHVLCEGQTEEAFVNRSLKQHLAGHGIALSASRLMHPGSSHRGGHCKDWRIIHKDLITKLPSFDHTTTMLDLYGLPANLPGRPTTLPPRPVERATALEDAMARSVNDARFIPALVLHEFEALLFSKADEIARLARVQNEAERELARKVLTEVASAFATAEDIDEGPTTHPARRISDALPHYRKTLHGPEIAAAIGLERMRDACPHFGRWITKLESLQQA